MSIVLLCQGGIFLWLFLSCSLEGSISVLRWHCDVYDGPVSQVSLTAAMSGRREPSKPATTWLILTVVRAFNASTSTSVRINQVVRGFDESLRPDIAAVNETCKTGAIIDIAMPFENRYAAFQNARQEKQKKYAPVAEHYHRHGYSVFLEAFIVGELGGLGPTNEKIINHLKVGRSYCRLMRKLMVSDVICWSCDIYIQQLSVVRQYQDTCDTRSG